jgi:hypothetical protein
MDHHRRSDGHYADVECAYAELERYLVLSCSEEARYQKSKAAEFRWPKLIVPCGDGAFYANEAAHNPTKAGNRHL